MTIHISICFFLFMCVWQHTSFFAYFSMLYSYVVLFNIFTQLTFYINTMLRNKIMLIHFCSGCPGALLRFSYRTLRTEALTPLSLDVLAAYGSQMRPSPGLPPAKGSPLPRLHLPRSDCPMAGWFRYKGLPHCLDFERLWKAILISELHVGLHEAFVTGSQ